MYDSTTEEFLGQGKFGQVFKVLNKKTKIPVAIKMITCNKPDNKNDVVTFEEAKKEIAALKQLQHENIVKIIDYQCHINKED